MPLPNGTFCVREMRERYGSTACRGPVLAPVGKDRRRHHGRGRRAHQPEQLPGCPLLLANGLIKLAGLAGEPGLRALAGETASGALPGVLVVGFALSCTLTLLWRRRLRLLLAIAITIGVMYIGHLEQVAQACGAAAGFVTLALYDRA
jgi:hypothetical protein